MSACSRFALVSDPASPARLEFTVVWRRPRGGRESLPADRAYEPAVPAPLATRRGPQRPVHPNAEPPAIRPANGCLSRPIP